MCWCLFLITMQAFRPATLVKRDSSTSVFLWILLNFWEKLFLENSFSSSGNSRQDNSDPNNSHPVNFPPRNILINIKKKKRIISGIQFYRKKINKKLKHCLWKRDRSIYKIIKILLLFKLIFPATTYTDDLLECNNLSVYSKG